MSALVLWRVVLPRFRRAMAEGDREWRDRFRALDPVRRDAIRHAMRCGEPVRDPEDVELLLRADAQLDYVHRAMRPLELMMLPIVAALLAFAIEHQIRFMFVIFGVGFAFWLLTGAGVWRQRRRRKQSVAATRRLHGA